MDLRNYNISQRSCYILSLTSLGNNEQIRVITVTHEDKFIFMYSETSLKNNSVQDLKPVFSSFFFFEIVQ